VEIRDLRPDETSFLHEMLYAALPWNPDSGPATSTSSGTRRTGGWSSAWR